jgi:hypothetical protein
MFLMRTSATKIVSQMTKMTMRKVKMASSVSMLTKRGLVQIGKFHTGTRVGRITINSICKKNQMKKVRSKTSELGSPEEMV